MARGSVELYDELKLAMAARDPRVRVVQSQCLGQCSDGITVVIQPDNRWFGHVKSSDIEEIVNWASSGMDLELDF
ncbi:(2Fe-2S) ferredoxin domain-containing protein [Candidatus Uhrbacteria bacterium]|nr:(2Fe-2S) ferredoxin domain-containing protein [Candidatus Uhrbacteria bacterium]